MSKEVILFFIVLFVLMSIVGKYTSHRMSRFERRVVGLIIGVFTFYISAGIGRLLGW